LNLTFPYYRGDFIPYSQREFGIHFDHWTGYYSTYPKLKQEIRWSEQRLRNLELNAFMHEKGKGFNAEKFAFFDKLENDVAMFTHHDAITSTSLPKTLADFESRLWNIQHRIESYHREMDPSPKD
jgi:hypothetical protein